MYKGNLSTAGTFAGLFINKAHALFFKISQSSFEVVHTQGNVLNAAAATVLFNKLGNR